MPKVRIIINGREYDSLDDVPEELRHLVRDADRDGVPDIIQSATGDLLGGLGGDTKAIIDITSSEVTLESVEETNDATFPPIAAGPADPERPSAMDATPPARIRPRPAVIRQPAKNRRGAKIWILASAALVLAGGVVAYLMMT